MQSLLVEAAALSGRGARPQALLSTDRLWMAPNTCYYYYTTQVCTSTGGKQTRLISRRWFKTSQQSGIWIGGSGCPSAPSTC